MPTSTYLVKRQGLPKPLDSVICADKRKCSSANDPDAHHGIPEIQSDSEVLQAWGGNVQTTRQGTLWVHRN